MTNRTCSFGDCETVIVRRHSLGRLPKYCDDHRSVAYKAKRKLYGRDSKVGTCTEPDCSRPLRARGMCSMHYRRWARSSGVEQHQGWNERRRWNYHKRLERLNHPGAENIQLHVVAERDGWLCGICGDSVDALLEYPDPMSKTTDHIRPLAKGGLHVWENVRLAHLECNVRKGDDFSEEADEMSA